MADICVVHLVRAKNGIEPFITFLESYKKYRGGIDHDLLIIFKGFDGENSTAEYRQLLKGISFNSLYVNDFGFDICAYFLAAKTINKKYFCFLNSFSTVLDNAWLVKLHAHVIKQNIGIVGATGSLESQYTNSLMAHSRNELSHVNIRHRLNVYIEQAKLKHYFDPFPNHHIRTNGFMISREVMRRIHHGIILSKVDAHRFESGKQSLTKQVLQMNLNVLVVGKNGAGYKMEDWCRSNTFRQGEQNNLLIADNQTNTYLHADPELKDMLSYLAWGESRI
jgi:hypothetical protein